MKKTLRLIASIFFVSQYTVLAEHYLSYLKYSSVNASSVKSASQKGPENVMDNSKYSWWSSVDGVNTVTFTIELDEIYDISGVNYVTDEEGRNPQSVAVSISSTSNSASAFRSVANQNFPRTKKDSLRINFSTEKAKYVKLTFSGIHIHGFRAIEIKLKTPSVAPVESSTPTVPNFRYTNNKLFKRMNVFKTYSPTNSSDEKGHNASFIHRGYLFLPFGEDSGHRKGGVEIYDISDPTSPKLVSSKDIEVLRETHGYGFYYDPKTKKDYAFMQSIRGVAVLDVTDVKNIELVKEIVIAGISSEAYDHGNYWSSVQYPYVYVSRNSDGFSVLDIEDIENPRLLTFEVDGVKMQRYPISKTGGFGLRGIFVLGNRLVLTGTNKGVSVIDVSNPQKPILMGTHDGGLGYSSYYYDDKVFSLSGTIRTFDVSDPTNIHYAQSSQNIGGSEYLTAQDDFIHAGTGGKNYIKYNYVTGQLVSKSFELLEVHGHKPQAGFANPIGNLVLVADDHSVSSGMTVHDVNPDENPPVPNMISPKPNSKSNHINTRIGIGFSDYIDIASFNEENVYLVDEEGYQVDAYYSVQNQRGQVFPKYSLKKNTSYAIVIKKGGVKDYVGNGADSNYVYTFSTGSGIQSVTNALTPKKRPAPKSTGLLLTELLEMTELRVYDIQGRLVFQKTVGGQGRQKEFNLSRKNLEPGLYVLKYMSEGVLLFTQKQVVQ